MKFKRTRSWLAQLVSRADHFGLVSQQRWIGMDKNRHAILPVLCERGSDSSVLVIAFSGGAQKLDVPVHEFFATTQTLGYHRILLWDRYQMYYHYGVDRKRRDWPSLIKYLQQEIARLQPKKVICVGTSAGGYAAIVAGHHVKADFVHAFSPQTEITLDLQSIQASRHPLKRWRMSISNRIYREVLDLAAMLRRFNGTTRFFLHYGWNHEIDRRFVERISEMPSVTTLGYPSDAHAIAIFLAKRKFLSHVLLIENQGRLAEIAKDYFGGKIRITETGPTAAWVGERSNQDIPRLHPRMK
jgi:hypothetical protein